MHQQDLSFGIIPVRQQDGQWEVLLVCHCTGYWWSFPKGHAEQGESPQQAAYRELNEETGLTVVRMLASETLTERYTYRRGKQIYDKLVTYFIAEVEGQLNLQEEELADAVWLPLNKIEAQVTYPAGKALCRGVIERLNKEKCMG